LDDGTLSWWGHGASPLGAGRVAVSFDRDLNYDAWHVCAALADGHVVCNSPSEVVRTSGALGYVPATTNVATPDFVDLGTGRTATSVATGSLFSCALLDDQSVKCWGANSNGELGQGDTTTRGLDASTMGDLLAPVPLGQPAIAITAGVSHACAILADHSVKCWGANDGGQLGIGSTAAIGDQPGELAALVAVDLGAGRTAVAIDAGSHTCVVLDNGAVKCWGNNTYGELGQGDTTTRGAAPGQMGNALPAIELGS
jgi:alpha-tubulin suppressor-like RCC1 family protein